MARLAYFPEPYPNELLYSLLARFAVHIGQPKPMHVLDMLYGGRGVPVAVALPTHLGALAERLPASGHWNIATLIQRHTLFPYFAAFEPPEVQGAAWGEMITGETSGAYLRLGLAAFRVRNASALLRYCPECHETMWCQYGELYWRRDHQLPGVLVCPTHGAALRNSLVHPQAAGRHAYIAATPANCPAGGRPLVERAANVMPVLLRLARRSAELLDSPEPGKRFSEWTSFYRSAMRDCGYVRGSRMNQARLHEVFVQQYGAVLNLVDANPPPLVEGGGWLSAIVRKHRKAFPPLYHVLIQDFLAQQRFAQQPFGEGPWPCRNPLAAHCGEKTIARLDWHRNHGHWVAMFRCSCGYIYSRWWNADRGQLGAPHFQSYGPLLAPALRQWVREGHSLREIARRVALDPKTVASLSRQFGLETLWSCGTKRKSTKSARWVNEKGKKQARRLPQHKDPPKRRPRRDWPALDHLLRCQLCLAAKRIRDHQPPVQVTLSALEKQCGGVGWLSKRKEKLPLTWALVPAVVESVEAFQVRRIDWAIEQFLDAHQSPDAWRIMRRAGLSGRHLDRIHDRLRAQGLEHSQ